MIPRHKPMKRSRYKPRPGRLKGDDMSDLRDEAYARDKGCCVACGRILNPLAPKITDDSFHLAHRRNKRMHGDHIDQVDCQCGKCHREEHHYGKSRIKPVPRKDVEPQ